MFKQILCIDDDPIALMLCKKVISKFQFSEEVFVAKNGAEALNLLENSHDILQSENNAPELIFLDLNMPVMGGWEFLDHITSEEFPYSNQIPVVILSSTIDPQDVARAKEYSVVLDFVSKPITKETLMYLSEKIRKKQS